MARPKNPLPSYLRHSSGKARAVWTDAAGVRHDVQLPGPFGSDESKAEFERILTLVRASSAPPARAGSAADPTVNELMPA